MALSKPFAIATEGPTVDGRTISRDWLTQMAASYNPNVYTAVANLEHYVSSLPDSVFGAYGKVISLATREAEIMGEKKLQLMAIIDANDDLIALQNKGKKAFPSMEVQPEFAKKPLAYLTGLAFTDKPASLGTETMKFNMAGATIERFAFDNEVEILFEEETKPGAGDFLFSKVKDLLGIGKKDADARFADQANAITAVAESQKALLDRFANQEKTGTDLAAQLKTSAEKLEAMGNDFAALKETLSTTDGDEKTRPPAAGGDGQIQTDC